MSRILLAYNACRWWALASVVLPAALGRLDPEELCVLKQLYTSTNGGWCGGSCTSGWDSSNYSSAPDPCDGTSWFGIYPWSNYSGLGVRAAACTPTNSSTGYQSLQVRIHDARTHVASRLPAEPGAEEGSTAGASACAERGHGWRLATYTPTRAR